MDAFWTTSTLAGELIELMPILGRTLTHHATTITQEKTTIQQVRALALLIEHPLTVSKLAKIRRVSLQAASTLVQGLVERGWVTRIPDPDDRRQSLLEVTPEGLAHARHAKELMINHLVGSLEGLEPEEIAALEVAIPALKRVLVEYLNADGILDDLPDE